MNTPPSGFNKTIAYSLLGLVVLLALVYVRYNGYLLLGYQNPPTNKAAISRPNILLIVADDLGYTDLGCYGSEIRTPHLDALAAEGIRATSFYTGPTCSPTRGMLLSGVDNHRCGYGTMEGDWAPNQVGVRGYEGHLNWDVAAFPTLLQDAGYHTSLAGKWHQAYPASDTDLWPDKRGFYRYFSMLQGGAGHFADMQPMFSFYGKKGLYAEDGKQLDSLPTGFYSSNFYAEKAISYIQESQELQRPFFSFLSFTAPHWPLQVPDSHIDAYTGQYEVGYEVLARQRLARAKEKGVIPENTHLPPLSPNVRPWEELTEAEQTRSSRNMEIYAAMVELIDENVGRVIDYLKESGAYDNTLIVFMADNGAEGNWPLGIADTEKWVAENFDNSLENLGRKNSYTYIGPAWAQVSSLPFKWYKTFATEGGVRCPAIFRFPDKVYQGSTYSGVLTVRDLAPTFLDFAGVSPPGSRYDGRAVFPMDGVSMLPWLRGKRAYVHEPQKAHCWELYGRRGVRKGNWKAEWLEAPYGSGTWELYNLETDIGELDNIAHQLPDTLHTLVQAWERYAAQYELILPSEPTAYGKELIWRE